MRLSVCQLTRGRGALPGSGELAHARRDPSLDNDALRLLACAVSYQSLRAPRIKRGDIHLVRLRLLRVHIHTTPVRWLCVSNASAHNGAPRRGHATAPRTSHWRLHTRRTVLCVCKRNLLVVPMLMLAGCPRLEHGSQASVLPGRHPEPGGSALCPASAPLSAALWEGSSRPCCQPFTHVRPMKRVRRSMACQLCTGGAGWTAAVSGAAALPVPVARNSVAATASLALNVAVYNVSCMLERCQAPVATPRAARQARLKHGRGRRTSSCTDATGRCNECGR